MRTVLSLDYSYHVRHLKGEANNISKFENAYLDYDLYFDECLQKEFEALKRIEDNNDFPYQVFPEMIKEIIKETHECLNYSIDFIGASVLYAISVAIGNTHRIQVKRGWEENSALYIAIVGRPGTNKSHPLSFAIAPLLKKDEVSALDYKVEKKIYDKAVAIAKKKRDGSENDIVKPKRTKAIITDYTPEALARIHLDNLRGIGVYSDELAGWIKNFNRYNGGSEVEFWLSNWSGKPINVDRVSADPIFISNPFISVIGTIQNKVLTELFKNERSNNGFIDRIAFVVPDNIKKEYFNEKEVSNHTINNWDSLVSNLLNLQVSFNETGGLQSQVLEFTIEAKEEYLKWQQKNTDECNETEDDFIKGIHSKLEVFAIRFSLILEMAKFACGESDKKKISLDSVKGALKLTEYFYKSAVKVYEIISNRKIEDNRISTKKKLHTALPNTFTSRKGLVIAYSLNISKSSYQRYLRDSQFIAKKGTLYEKISVNR